ncbi:extensin-like [Durio zibethinus]|uniref:Extensin-like n=1 Tax=Durio zibethinus TaxID=66656 RepID=A0A6P5XUW8_DURZI|nr:extensin-like [Durio zibethinus]
MMMGLGYSQLSLGSKWLVLLLKVGIMVLIMLARVTSEDELGIPSAGLLCISDCATCPVICSPPPPPLLKSFPPPPPSVHHSPPPVPYYYIPPQSYSHSPPPAESVPPTSPLRPPPPAPSSYSSKGSPPPPFKYFYNAPPGQGPPTVVGPHQYPYPYYYFYASKASSLYFQASLSLVNIVMFQCCAIIALLKG